MPSKREDPQFTKNTVRTTSATRRSWVALNNGGFTLVELLAVISIITVLMGMTLGILRYASNKSAREKARAEIAAFCGAAENYKADNATYPRDEATDGISAGNASADQLKTGSFSFYRMISGDSNANGIPDKNEGGLDPLPVYLDFKASQLGKSGSRVQYIRDPWDKGSSSSSYGYATKRARLIENGADDPAAGRNTTFDIWSAANSPDNPKVWIGNW